MNKIVLLENDLVKLLCSFYDEYYVYCINNAITTDGVALTIEEYYHQVYKHKIKEDELV
jgi:hypothetical protein